MKTYITADEVVTIQKAVDALLHQRSTFDQEQGTDNKLLDASGEILMRLKEETTLVEIPTPINTISDIQTGPHIVLVHPGTEPRSHRYIQHGSRFFNQNAPTVGRQWVARREDASEYPTDQAARIAAANFNIKLTN